MPRPDSSQPRSLDRRTFLHLTAAAAAAAALAPPRAFAQSAPTAPTPAAPVAPATGPTPPSDEARALTAILQKRFPDRLTDEQWEAVARDFEADLGAGRRLRALALTNADEPDAGFRA